MGLEHGVIVSCGCRWFLWHTYFVREILCTKFKTVFERITTDLSDSLGKYFVDLRLVSIIIYPWKHSLFFIFGQQCHFFNKIVHDLIWWTERTKHHSIRSRLLFCAAVKKSPNLSKLWIAFHMIFVIWYPRWPKCIPWKFLLKIFFSKRVKLKSRKSFFANVTLSQISRQMLLMLVCKSTK